MALTFKSCSTVKPSRETWQGVMSLSMFDQTGNITHEPTVYLYRRPPNESLSHPDSLADSLKASLGQALDHFYPFAGRLQWCEEGKGRLELNCNAMGAEFTEAHSDSELEHMLEDGFLPPEKSRHLIPDYEHKYKILPYEKIPLLMVQITRFACGGISLGFALSQAITDGMSSGHFWSEWARLTRGEPLKTAPFMDRGVLRAGEPPRVSMSVGPEDFSLPQLMKHREDDIVKPDDYIHARLKLAKEHVEKVKKTANSGRKESEISRPYTRYEALTAHIWRCASKARNYECIDQPTGLLFPVDTRGRVKPPLPPNYMGSAVCEVLANGVSGDLISRHLGYTASIIRAAIEGINDEFIWNWIDRLKSLPDLACMQNLETHLNSSIDIKNPNLAVCSWLTLPMYDLDFGWGKNFYMGAGEIEGEYFYLIPCPSGDGSVLLEFRLHTLHMNSFKDHFYNDMV